MGGLKVSVCVWLGQPITECLLGRGLCLNEYENVVLCVTKTMQKRS